MLNCLIVGAGGFIGSSLRYLVSRLPVHPSLLPCLTLLVNVTGAFALGVVIGLIEHSHISRQPWQLFLVVGVCGGFTTFSTFAFESESMLTAGRPGLLLAYAVGSVVSCIAAVWLGRRIVSA